MKLDELTNEELIEQFRVTKDEYIKEYFFDKNKGLTYHVANNQISGLRKRSDFEDFISIGNIGLVKAFNTFDTSKKRKFTTYAITIIRNEMLLELRKEKTRKQIETVSENTTIHKNKDGNDISIIDTLMSNEIDNDTYLMLKDKLHTLEKLTDEREKKIFKLHYHMDMSQNEIAKIIGKNQSMVSRTLKRVNKRLNDYIEYGKIEA